MTDGRARHVRRPPPRRRSAVGAPGQRPRPRRRRRGHRARSRLVDAAVPGRPPARAVPQPPGRPRRHPGPAAPRDPRRRVARRSCAATARARSSPAADVHERLDDAARPVDGWFVEVDELTGTRSRRPSCSTWCDHAACDRSTTAPTSSTSPSPPAGVDPAGHRGDPSVPLDPEAARPRRLPARSSTTSATPWSTTVPGTIDDIDPEFLHDFRVAVRRTRSVLGHAKDVLPADVLDWSRDGFRTLGQVTGPARDLDVYVLEWDSYVAASAPETVAAPCNPVRAAAGGDRAAAHAELAAALRSSETTELLERWRSWLADPVDTSAGGDRADRPVGAVVRRRIEKAQDRLLDGGSGDHPDDAGRRRPRAAQGRQEAALPPGVLRRAAAGRPSARRSSSASRSCRTTSASTRTPPSTSPSCTRRSTSCPPACRAETFVAIGQLIEQLDRRRQAARDEFAERFARYDSKATHRAFADVAGRGSRG